MFSPLRPDDLIAKKRTSRTAMNLSEFLKGSRFIMKPESGAPLSAVSVQLLRHRLCEEHSRILLVVLAMPSASECQNAREGGGFLPKENYTFCGFGMRCAFVSSMISSALYLPPCPRHPVLVLGIFGVGLLTSMLC